MSPNKPHFDIFKNLSYQIKYSKVIENRRLYFGESKDLQHDDGNNSSSILSPSLIITSPYLATTKINLEDSQVFGKTHIQSCAIYCLTFCI
jgi:hypothetical protein